MKKYLNTKLVGIALAIALVGSFVPASLNLAHAQSSFYPGSQTSMLPNYAYNTQTFTATSQTGATINLGGVSYGTISVIGTGLTTATFEIDGSNDGGLNFFPLNTAAITVPGTVATTQAVTTNKMFIVNLAGITNVVFKTSGTFTATNIKVKLVATPNKGLL